MDSMNLAPYIDNERLADYAVSCARLLKSTGTQSGTEAALRLHESIRELRRCRDTLHRRYTGAPAVPSGCEWLLDNWYMVQREGPAAEDELRRALAAELVDVQTRQDVDPIPGINVRLLRRM